MGKWAAEGNGHLLQSMGRGGASDNPDLPVVRSEILPHFCPSHRDMISVVP
jgi:hypothetical protein